MTHLHDMETQVLRADWCKQSLTWLGRLIVACGLLATMAEAAQLDSKLASAAQASTPQVTATLLSASRSVSAGQQLTLAVKLDIQPHWHTYWRNPGDSGTVTTIDWHFSHPAQAGEIAWPLPDRFKMGPIVNYGYAHQVTLPVNVTLGAAVREGEVFRAEAAVDWLVCKEECIPQQVKLSLALPVVAVGQSRADTMPAIEAALAAQPLPAPWPVRLTGKATALQLHVDAPNLKSAKDLWFYPEEWGRIAQSRDQVVKLTASGIVIGLEAGDLPLHPGAALRGVLVVNPDKKNPGAQKTGYMIAPELENTAPVLSNKPDTHRAAYGEESLGLLMAVGLAFLGGLVLNLMPCVFPVLSMKALALIAHSQLSRAAMLRQGLVYTAGVVSSFVLLAGVLIILKTSGSEVGWGFQFQSPYFVFAMAYLLFGVGLSLSGVFTIGGSISNVGSGLAEQPGDWGSFFTGVLATVVATPCTAPFMAAALGYALTQPAPALLTIFISLGLGLAFPYLLLTSWPRLHRHLPRPGVWMEYAKQLFAFPMYAAAIWLVWVLAQQQGEQAVAAVLAGMLLLAFAAWLYAHSRGLSSWRFWLANSGVAVSVLLATGLGGVLATSPAHQASSTSQGHASAGHVWQPYSAAKLEQLLSEGKPVFLNFTAAWCISCLVNEKVALSQPEVVEAFKQHGITYLKGDWTNKDAEITRVLAKFGRSGVPLYVFYPAGAGSQPVELPQILTPTLVLSTFSSTPH